MSVLAAKTKAKPKSKMAHNGNQPIISNAAFTSRNPAQYPSQRLSAFYSCGPAVGLASSVQAKFTIGQANDPYEREADAVADRVASGQPAPPISSIPPGGLGSIAQPEIEEKEKPEEMPPMPMLVQRQAPEEEDLEESPPMPMLIQRQEVTEEVEEPEEISPMPMLIQRQAEEEESEETRPMLMAVQRQEAAEGEEELEESSPMPMLIQRQETVGEEEKPEEESPMPMLIQRQEEEEPEETPPMPMLVQRQEMEEEEKRAETTVQTKFLQLQPLEEEKAEEKTPQAKLIQCERVEEEEEEPKPQTRLLQTDNYSERSNSQNDFNQNQLQRRVSEDNQPDETDLQAQQHSSTSRSGYTSRSRAISRAMDKAGTGEPLKPSMRKEMESGLGVDLSDVRVHSDGASHGAAKLLKARAFTHGSDIWLGSGQSQDDTRLMAHETAHVVQQTGSVQRKFIQRAGKKSTTTNKTGAGSGGNLKTGLEKGDTITFESITIPSFKNILHRGQLYKRELKRRKGETVVRSGEHATNQRDKWKDGLDKSQITQVLNDKLTKAHAGKKPTDQTPVWEVALAGGQYRYFFGSVEKVAREMTTPDWYGRGSKGYYKRFDVDHIVELQLANWPDEKWANELSNMELLESRKNQKSGSAVKGRIESKIKTFLKTSRGIKKPGGADIKDIKSKYTLIFNKAVGLGGPSVNTNDYWTQKQIESGDHLKPVKGASASEIGGSSFVRIFSREAGGASRKFSWSSSKEPQKVTNSSEKSWLKPFVTTEKFFKTDADAVQIKDFGQLKVKIPANHKIFQETAERTVSVSRVLDARYGGMIDRRAVMSELRKVKVKHASPLSFANIDLDPVTGFNAQGKLLPSIPLLDRLDVGLELKGGELVIFKEFTLDEFKDKIPKPFELRALTLKIFYSTGRGFGFDGQADFAIEKVGEGQLKGGFSTGQGISLVGNFSFVKSLFDPAEVGFAYENGNWSASGKLGIKDGKVPGIKSAVVTAAYKDKVFSATGTVEPKIPGVKSGGFEVKYSEKEGLIIGGTLDLSSEVPLLKSGSAKVRLHRKPDKTWSTFASIQADLDIPGLKHTSLTGFYNDGVYGLSLTAGFKYGLASGTATVGVTNQGVDDKGKATKEQPSEKLKFYGSGYVILTLAPFKAGAGIVYNEKGEVKISGSIAPTKDIVLFKGPKPFGPKGPRFKVSFPIASIGVADVSIDIGGGLGVYAKIGDGVLRNVKLEVEYDFANEDAASAKGTAEFYMPAEAGMKGDVTVGISGRVLIVKAGGEIELAVGAALKIPASLKLDVNWNKKKGFSIDLTAKVIGSVSAFASVTGRLYVDVDYWLGSKRVWESDPYNIARRELGSKLKMGIVAPVSYSQKEGFKGLSLSSIKFIYPSASEAKSALKDFVEGLV